MSASAATQSAVSAPGQAGRGEQRFAIDTGVGPLLTMARGVLTEIPLGASLQPIPNAPPVLAGAINLRGAIRLVFNPLAWAGTTRPPGPRTILLVDRGDACAGLLILGEPRLVTLGAVRAEAATGPFARFVLAVHDLAGQPLLELDHRAWFNQLRDPPTPA